MAEQSCTYMLVLFLVSGLALGCFFLFLILGKYYQNEAVSFPLGAPVSGGSPPRSLHCCSGRCEQGCFGDKLGRGASRTVFPFGKLNRPSEERSLGKAVLGGGAACVLQVVGCAAGHVLEITSDMYRKWDSARIFCISMVQTSTLFSHVLRGCAFFFFF